MQTAKLGKKGQLSIPKAILEDLGLEPESTLVVETTPDGAIVLRPAAVYPIELYSEERIRELLDEDRLAPEEAERLRARGG